MENRPLVQSECCFGNYLLRVSWSSITFCGPFKSIEERTFLLKQYMTLMQLGWDSAARYSEPSDHFHTNYKSICIIYGLPITVKVTDLALNVLRSLIHSFHMHYIFSVKVLNELTAHLESLARLRGLETLKKLLTYERWDGKSAGSCTPLQGCPSVFLAPTRFTHVVHVSNVSRQHYSDH